MKPDDEPFVAEAIELATKCPREHGSRDPMVAAIVVRDGKVISRAHRGEIEPGQHAEFIALDVKPDPSEIFAGATLYTTLEPCTVRGTTKKGTPKIPCVERVIARKFKRVVIGMLDPNQSVRGLGVIAMRKANIEIDFFDHEFAARVEDLNRDFIRHFSSPTKPQPKPQPVPTAAVMRASGSLEQFLKAEDRQRAVVLLGIAPDVAEDGAFRLDFECSFRPIRFRQESSGRIVYYAAFRRASLDVDVDQGEIVSHAPEAILPAGTTSSIQRVQRVTSSVQSMDDATHPPVVYEAGSTWEGRTRLRDERHALEVTPARRHVRWDLSRSREPAKDAFLSGEMHATVTVRWRSVDRHGVAELTPESVDFLDHNHQRIGSLRSILMWRALRNFAKDALFQSGCRVKFEVVDAA